MQTPMANTKAIRLLHRNSLQDTTGWVRLDGNKFLWPEGPPADDKKWEVLKYNNGGTGGGEVYEFDSSTHAVAALNSDKIRQRKSGEPIHTSGLWYQLRAGRIRKDCLEMVHDIWMRRM